MKSVITAILVLTFMQAMAQKKEMIENTDAVVKRATSELNQAMQPEGSIRTWAAEKNITGEYTFDITIHEKGQVATVFVAGNEGGDIKMQNLLKDHMKTFEFNFKMPKGKKYKFQYKFTFN